MIDVLLIEDDEDIRSTTLEFLEMESISAFGCDEGQKALDFLRSLTTPLPKLIIADLSMPGLGGIAFREAQLKDPRLKGIPCAIMSADDKIDAKCRDLGIAEKIHKPIDLDHLLQVIRKYTGGAALV